ncbi:T9SS type A sorting domain-containing protein [candidate division WOR-3 bacterium]|nr:T9SS type A sorting domain-containing protein [candidate division WOR-3 bacterium]
MRQLSLIFILTGVVLAAAPRFGEMAPQPSSGYPFLTEVTDEPAAWWLVWWTGVGDVSDFLVSNAMQGGVFARHPDDEHEYQGLPGYTGWYPVTMGRNAEYPANSEQFYLYAMGFWFGALYPLVDTLTGDTSWIRNVSKAAYSSDMGAMAVPEMRDAGGMHDISSLGLYFSDMRIPEGWGFEGEGDRLFARPGETPKPYQAIWPFADTMLNKNRPPDEQLDPSKGDIVSDEDTYAVGGDWIPVDSATTIWILTTGSYDGLGLGIRAEQRTYSWNRGVLANAIVLNYKIRNMNDFSLKAPYFSYFADPDIGEGGSVPGDEGYWDDMIGFDRDRNLGYAYDANGSEPGWSTPVGYIGAVLLETPGDEGLTGFETWPNGHDIDELGQDSLKYAYMTSTDFVTRENPDDVRMLLNSGPYPDMAPGDEYDFTLAVVVGETLAKLRENVDSVRAAFDRGFSEKVDVEEESVPASLGLTLSGPLVFSDLLKLRYSLPNASGIDLALFDASGRRIETLKQGYAFAGEGEIAWNASRVPVGVYFVRLSACGSSFTERVLIIR